MSPAGERGARAVGAELRRIGAIARRDALVHVSYQFNLIFFFASAFVSAFIAFYVSELVGDSEVLRRYDGSYFDFVVLGLALTSYGALGVATFTDQLRQEQGAGTLEVLLAGPTRLPTLLAGGFCVPLAMTTLQVAAFIGIGVGWLGTGLAPGRVVVALPVIALTVVNFCAMGIASAALVLLVKRGDPISGPLYQATLILSGAVFPIELFPGWLQVVSRATPAYYGVRGLREALLTDGGLRGVGDEITVLAVFGAVTVPLALAMFSRSVAAAKRLGVLGAY